MGAASITGKRDSGLIDPKGHRKSQSMKSTTRSLTLKSLISIAASAFLLTASACQPGSKQEPIAEAPLATQPSQPRVPNPYPGVQQLTSVGENSGARYSSDGFRILFTSRGRSSHRMAQIYELDLNSWTEKRLTFSDGTSIDPVYLAGDAEFLFASSTDEIKEEPAAIARLMRTYHPEGLKEGQRDSEKKSLLASPEIMTEIYLQSHHGRKIERLTTSNGYDAEADIDRKSGKRFVFTSNRSQGVPSIYLADLSGGAVQRLSQDQATERSARFSPDGKMLVWYRQGPDETSSKILVAEGNFRKPRELVNLPAANLHPTWHPNGNEIVFSSNRDGKHFQLYVVDLEGKCIRQLTQMSFDQTQPAVSPDGNRILFSGRRNGQQQIFQMDYKPSDGCLPL
jgi:Tol biopolymer transport system component